MLRPHMNCKLQYIFFYVKIMRTDNKGRSSCFYNSLSGQIVFAQQLI
jgi:hypothetical protein